MAVDLVDLVRGKSVVAAISFHDTILYPTDALPGERPERIVFTDEHGRAHKIHHRPAIPVGPTKP